MIEEIEDRIREMRGVPGQMVGDGGEWIKKDWVFNVIKDVKKHSKRGETIKSKK